MSLADGNVAAPGVLEVRRTTGNAVKPLNPEAGESISHNLRTVMLDPQGRICRQFDGNEWTAEHLAREGIRASAAAGKLALVPQ